MGNGVLGRHVTKPDLTACGVEGSKGSTHLNSNSATSRVAINFQITSPSRPCHPLATCQRFDRLEVTMRPSILTTAFGCASYALSTSDDAPPYRHDLLKLHRSLVSIKSTSGLEQDAGSFLADFLFDNGWASTIQFVPPRSNTPEGYERMNIIAWPEHNGVPDPKVLLTSHLDTVPPHIPYGIDDGEITRDTKISGRGSVDAKASVAGMIMAVEELLLKDKIEREDVMVLFVVGEEVSGDGMRWFNDSLDKMDHPPSFDTVIFGEPTENKLACGHKGALFCSLDVQGKASHSGYPWLGKSANELLVRAMVKVMDTDLGSNERFGNTTVNLGVMEGGVAENVIPEKANAGILVRVALGPQDTGGKVVQDRMQAILDDMDEEAFDFKCAQGYGSIEANCDVDGGYLPSVITAKANLD